jgi:hypothetical protein
MIKKKSPNKTSERVIRICKKKIPNNTRLDFWISFKLLKERLLFFLREVFCVALAVDASFFVEFGQTINTKYEFLTPPYLHPFLLTDKVFFIQFF